MSFLWSHFEPWFVGRRMPIWFGLTQMQEARSGFDAATRLGQGRLLLLQFKAGRRMRRGIRFTAQHTQLEALRARTRAARAVFYVLPAVTRTRELSVAAPPLLAQTWLLDVAHLPPLDRPARASGYHNLTLDEQTGIVTIQSDPVEVRAIRADKMQEWSPNAIGYKFDGFDDFWETVSPMHGTAACLGLPSAMK